MPERFFWKARLVAKGPYVGVVTWRGPPLVDGEELDRGPRWQARIRNEASGRAVLMGNSIPIEVDGAFLRNIEKIGEDEYNYLLAHAAYSVAHSPMNADAMPTEKIDVRGRSIF